MYNIPARAASAEPIANVIDIVLFTLIPTSCAAPLSSDTARIAVPAFVLFINNVNAIIDIVVTINVTMVIPEIFKLPNFTDCILITELKGIGFALNIKRETLCKK